MTITTIRLWAILCLLTFAAPVYGTHYGNSSDIEKTIRIGIFSFNPINYIDKDGTAMGLNPDLLREIFRDKATRLAFVPGSWAEGLERLKNQEIDLMMAVAYSDQRAKVMDFGHESVLQLWGQVFARPDFHLTNISDLFDRRVGVMSRDISGKNFITTIESLGGHCRIIEYPSHDQVFLAVQQGEVDAGVAPQHFGLRHANEHDLVGTSILFSPFSIYFATQKGLHGELLKHIDDQLRVWKADKNSFYYEILNRWMSPVGSKKRLPAWLLPAFLLLLAAAVASFGFILLLNAAVKRKTRELKNSETRFRDVALNISDWVWEVDTRGIYTYCSEHSLALLGYTAEEVVGKSLFDFRPEEEVQSARRFFREMLDSAEAYRDREQTCLRKDGSKIFLRSSALPITSDDGELLGYRGVDADITAKKKEQAEKQLLENRLAQAQKMEAVGTLAGGIAHDFNNILAAILGYTELAMTGCSDDSTMAKDLKAIHHAGNRAKDLVKQILAFSRQSETSRILLQPAHIISEALKILRPSLPSTIEISKNIEHTDDVVLADPSQLSQIIMNLCTNAFHAMEEKGGLLDITMKKVTLLEEDLREEAHVQPGAFMLISVADSGIGFSQEIKDKIFDPYFTTKEMGKGTGMGLSIVHGIVKSYGGFINCSSQPGKGSVFHVYLPIQQKSEATNQALSTTSPTGSERILFIDDEQVIAQISKKFLEGLGYTVRAVTSSREALDLFLKSPDGFDLVITDQTMPNMTGAELAARMLQIRPDLPIILCTGFSTIMTKEKARAIGIREFVFKPLTKQELAGLIRKVLQDDSWDEQQEAVEETVIDL